jgi:hypothetical protein
MKPCEGISHFPLVGYAGLRVDVGWWATVFGTGFDPDSIPSLPVAALPYTLSTYKGRRVVVRFWYSPDPRHADDIPAIHRAMIRAVLDSSFHRHYLNVGISRLGVFGLKIPEGISGAVSIWVRDVALPRSEFPEDLVHPPLHAEPFWLRFDSPRKIRFDVIPADTPGGRARQRIDRVRKRGGVQVRAALVQANSELLAPGPNDQPCLVLFSFDERVAEEEMLDLASRVFALKNTNPKQHDLAFVARLTTDEVFVYYGRERLPRSFAGRLEYYVSHLYVHRPFLQSGYLDGRILDCIAEPGERGMIELLPWNPNA